MLLPSHLRNLGKHGRLALFCLLCSIAGVWCIQVVVPQRVNTVLGKDLTLECGVEMDASFSHVQTSWERRLPSGSGTIAVYSPDWGIAIPPEFLSRLYFRSPSSHDATIILKNVAFADIGIYTCKVITFPEGITLATTTVNVLDPPTLPCTIPAPVLSGSTSPTLVDEKGHVLPSSPTLEALPESNLGSTVCGALGGALFLLLLLSLGVCYRHKQQTLRSNYSANLYLRCRYIQKAPTQHFLEPTKHQDHGREEWGVGGYTQAMREQLPKPSAESPVETHNILVHSRPDVCRPYSPKLQGSCSPCISDGCYDSVPDSDPQTTICVVGTIV